jgi:hypothetical protein
MEPRGCNRWQPVANPNGPKTVETSENRCRELRPLFGAHGKEGVDGSGPSEGFPRPPQHRTR